MIKSYFNVISTSAWLSALAIVALTGCQGPQIAAPPTVGCEGMATIYDAAAALAAQREQLIPLQATAQCRMEWRDADGKTQRERFDAQVRFMPPEKLFFRGHRFGEIRFGTNAEQFWLRIKPELDTYWYGSRRQAQECSHVLMMNPANLTEALGMVQVDAQWELFHRDGWDLLTERDNGMPVRRVYVDACDYRVRRIEYYDRFGQVTSATELADYITLPRQRLAVPRTIRLVTLYQGLEESSVLIELDNIREFSPRPQQIQNLFQRPDRDGYGTMLRLDEQCNFVEEN